MSTINPCNRAGYRENLFARALAKLKLGGTQAEIEAFFEGKNLVQRYTTSDGKILPAGSGRGFTAWELLQKLEKGETLSVPKLTETIVTNLNKEVIQAWEVEGLGDVVTLDGLKIFQPNENYKASNTNWDFHGAHGELAALKAGIGDAESLLIVDRNTWQRYGLTKALHEAAARAPLELQEVYQQAAKRTVGFLKTGRIEKRLQDVDANVAPSWAENNFLTENKGVQASTKAVETYLNGQLKKATKAGTEPEINPKTLLRRFSDQASKGFMAVRELLSPKTEANLDVTFNPVSKWDPKVVLDPAAGNLGEQVARELFLAEITSRLDKLPLSLKSLRQLRTKGSKIIPQGLSEVEVLRLILRDPQLKAEMDAALRVGEYPQTEPVLWNLKEELQTGGNHTPLSKQMDSFWKETKLEERTPEPEPEVDAAADAIREVDAYHESLETDLPDMPHWITEEIPFEEELPFWEDSAPEPIQELSPEAQETKDETHIELVNEVTGNQTSKPIKASPDPKAAWVSGGELMTPEEVALRLNLVTGIEPELLHTLKSIPSLKESELIDHLVNAIRESDPNTARILADYVSLWRGPKEFQTFENFDTALNPCRK